MDEKNEGESKGNKNTLDNIEQTEAKASSPKNNNNNSSDLSNSSSTSNAENNETLQDHNCNEKSTKRGITNKEDGGNTEKAKVLLSKEDCNLLANVKKEENSLSPMSPVGFDSIANTEISGQVATGAAKNNEHARLAPKSNSHEKSSLSSPSSAVSCKEEINPNTSSNSAVNAPNAMLHQQFGSSGGAVSNCLDYMQQQNHIFVFSTQLANKGAESVLSGQFQTIIAYHCTQPSTKNFLEEFFMKNPMKMSKLPRNMLNIGAAHGGNNNNNNNNNQWTPGGNGNLNAGNTSSNVSKSTKLGSNNKAMNFNLLNTNAEQKPAIGKTVTPSSANVPGFLDGNDNETDLIHHCWGENNHRGDVKIGDNIEHANPLSSKTSSLNSETTKLMGGGSDQIPSLQGVKVPDENLTPQQRQHREEQLAKLKKIDKILFPENDSAATQTQTTTQPINKMANDNSSVHQSGLSNLMMNLGGGGGTTQQIRNNIIPGQKLSSDSESGMNVLGGGASEQLHTENMAKTGNLSCEPPMNPSVMNMQGNNMLMPNINESNLASNGFNQCGGSGNLSTGDEKIIANAAPQDIGALDWPKLQNQYVDERLKGGNKPPNEVGLNRLNLNSSALCGNVRSNPNQTPSNPTPGGGVQRGGQGQGPPPPYHSTQRSASVPIATQSPNPSSPNNPTSNLSLPSPSAGPGATGSATSVATLTTNSPNDMGNAPANVPPCSSANTGLPGQINKGAFSNEGSSPLNNNNTSRNRNSQQQGQLNSNPSTPLSHMSPKDMEAFNSNMPDHQQTSIEGRFPTSPGFNFPPHIQNASGGNVNVNNFKAQLDRPVPNPPFGRRTENIPLNPNSGRTPQNKLGNVPFDPISSLAQMSQQLTSCVPSGGNSNVGCNELNMPANISMGHTNMDGMLPNMDSSLIEGSNLMPQSSGSMSGGGVFGQNNCNVNALMMGPMGNPQHRLLNPKMCGNGPPGGFNSPGNNNQGNFHGVLPPPTNHPHHPHHHHQHRLRMPGMNFNNFNVSPNIQVKASTPNTIQYMPVRPQNNNNMRAPPSLDFLQRYANPTQIDNHVGPGGGSHLSQMNSSGGMASDGNKMNSTAGGGISGIGGGSSAMNFFQHCNQSMDPDDIASGNGMIPTTSHDVNVNMIRGLRPMRQNNMVVPGVGNQAPQRMMAPNNAGSVMQYPGGGGGPPPTQDSLDCGDMSNLFGSGGNPSNNPNQLFHMSGGGSHKPGKAGGGGMLMGHGSGVNVAGGMCSNLGANNGGLLSHEQHNGMPSPINQSGMLGPNMMSNSTNTNGPQQLPIVAPGPNSSNMNYKPFVGPASNDLKYAQQYHSFQQQLYATSTRSQQQNGNSMGSVAQNSNSPFFVNK